MSAKNPDAGDNKENMLQACLPSNHPISFCSCPSSSLHHLQSKQVSAEQVLIHNANCQVNNAHVLFHSANRSDDAHVLFHSADRSDNAHVLFHSANRSDNAHVLFHSADRSDTQTGSCSQCKQLGLIMHRFFLTVQTGLIMHRFFLTVQTGLIIPQVLFYNANRSHTETGSCSRCRQIS